MRNSLFSDYYLAELFPHDEAVAAAREQVPALRLELRHLLAELGTAPESAGEAELEDSFIRPVLRLLGFEWLPQAALRPTRRVPDYLLFSTEADRRWAAAHRDEAWARAVGLAEAKRWGTALDRSARGTESENRNPSLQVDEYLRSSDLSWGILTDGRRWRLYNRDTSYRLDSFLEVDLFAAMDAEEELLSFAALFSRTAFPGPGSNGLLERSLSESIDHAQSLGSSLQASVYEALRLLCEGLLAAADRQGVRTTLSDVRHAAFVVIFRLLFVLYAEARGYLPVENRAYELSFSLRELAHELADREQLLAELSPGSFTYWTRLQALFHLIEVGSNVDPQMAAYDGGLFDADRYPLLTQLQVGDPWIGRAVNRLTRADLPRGRGFVSYRDLGVRELGTVYEALLEQHPFVASEAMVVVRRGDKLLYEAASTARGRVVERFPAGSVLLRTDRGERRETGTYYTPGPIVRYMASTAISKALEGRVPDDLVDAVLSLRVVDPAMGSGHFLVEAVDVLARELVAALEGRPAGRDDETEIRWARREVVERCIYGVDLNPLAVELAKLSLWLVTIEAGKPLSFLDHHLRCGNSVVFYPVEAAVEGRLPTAFSQQDGLFSPESLGESTSRHLLEAMRAIANRPSDTIDDVAAKRQEFEEAFERQAGVRKYLSLCTAAVFDHSFQRSIMPAFLTLYQGGQWRTRSIDEALRAATSMAEERRFFHWQAEFPEVFYSERRGFDVVLSNPPYVSAWSMERSDPALRDAIPRLPQFHETAVRHWDLFVPFVALGLSTLAESGVLAFILPNPANRELYAENLRARVLADTDMIAVVDFGSANVFDAVSRQNVIWVAQKRGGNPVDPEDDAHPVHVIDPDSVRTQPTMPLVRTDIPQGGWRTSPHSQIRSNLTPEEAALVAKLSAGVSRSRVFFISATALRSPEPATRHSRGRGTSGPTPRS